MLNMDFSQAVILQADAMDWEASPKEGVWRKPFAREEVECGHATSIVRFAPDSHFSEHGHPLGEEILILEGVFSDASGDYAAGMYLRNPEGFRHAPFSQPGCTIFVKLHQFQEHDLEPIRINAYDVNNWETQTDGVQCLPLHDFVDEKTVLLKYAMDSEVQLVDAQGVEVLVVSGSVIDQKTGVTYAAYTWMREPDGLSLKVAEATVLWVKTGHLS